MTAIIYKPQAIKSNSRGTRNELLSKHCAASVKNNNQDQVISSTIISALKQGLNHKSHVTALCDGAKNCWSVVDAIGPLCGKMICILDWFHVAMKMQNSALPEVLKSKFMRIKWYLWRGNTKNVSLRIAQLKEKVKAREEHDN